MDSRNAVENIVTWMRDRDERLNAWIKVIDQKLGHPHLQTLHNDVENQLARDRARPSYVQSLAEFQRELDDATEESTLIALIYSLGPGSSNVGQ
jgi:hypothetical protein